LDEESDVTVASWLDRLAKAAAVEAKFVSPLYTAVIA